MSANPQIGSLRSPLKIFQNEVESTGKNNNNKQLRTRSGPRMRAVLAPIQKPPLLVAHARPRWLCVLRGLCCKPAQGAGTAGKMAGVSMAAVASWLPARRWGRAIVSFGLPRGLGTLLTRNPNWAPRWLPGQYPKGGSGMRSFKLPESRPSLPHAFLPTPFKSALPPILSPPAPGAMGASAEACEASPPLGGITSLAGGS